MLSEAINVRIRRKARSFQTKVLLLKNEGMIPRGGKKDLAAVCAYDGEGEG